MAFLNILIYRKKELYIKFIFKIMISKLLFDIISIFFLIFSKVFIALLFLILLREIFYSNELKLDIYFINFL